MRILIALLLSFATVAHAENPGLMSGLDQCAHNIARQEMSGEDLTLDGYVVRPDRPGRFPLVIMTSWAPQGDG